MNQQQFKHGRHASLQVIYDDSLWIIKHRYIQISGGAIKFLVWRLLNNKYRNMYIFILESFHLSFSSLYCNIKAIKAHELIMQ